MKYREMDKIISIIGPSCNDTEDGQCGTLKENIDYNIWQVKSRQFVALVGRNLANETLLERIFHCRRAALET